MSKICKGDGECLIQNDINNYIKDDDFICNHYCIPIKCKNYFLCGDKFPEMYIGCWGGKGLCRICPVYNKEKTCISQPYCNHLLCIECFKEWYGLNWEYNVEQPNFPYSEDIKLEYEDFTEDIKIFENKYPLMKKYNEELNKWFVDETEEYIKIKHIFRICPICNITKEIKYNQIIENNEIYKKCFKIFKKNWLMKKYEDNK